MTFIEFFKNYNKPYIKSFNNLYINRCPVIICNDGFIISVQAGKGSHSIPSENVKAEEYIAFEINSLNYIDANLQEYKKELSDDDKENQIVATYHYVPIEDIEFIIEDHGGIDDNYIYFINKELKKDTDDVINRKILEKEIRHPCQISIQYFKKGR